MTFNINPAVFSSTYGVPTDVADKYLKIATHTQLKVLLYFMRNISQGIDEAKIADALALPQSEVADALLFWAQSGVLNSEQPKQQENKPVIIDSAPPSRADVIKRGLEDKNLMFLLREAQLKFGRNLKQNESQLLVSLYDDHGMKVSVILFLLGYAVNAGKCNISFIKKTAAKWLNLGIETVEEADRLVAQETKEVLAWTTVRTAFGLEKRKPSAKELELSNLWINEWKISTDMLKAAYDVCVDTKSKFSMPYVISIIENWHKDGITSPQDITAKKPSQPVTKSGTKAVKPSYAGYDLSKYEEMLNKKLKDEGDSDDA